MTVRTLLLIVCFGCSSWHPCVSIAQNENLRPDQSLINDIPAAPLKKTRESPSEQSSLEIQSSQSRSTDPDGHVQFQFSMTIIETNRSGDDFRNELRKNLGATLRNSKVQFEDEELTQANQAISLTDPISRRFTKFQTGLRKELPDDLRNLSSPTIVTTHGRTAKIMVGQNAPTQYFERINGHDFRLKKLDNQTLGINWELNAKRIESSNEVRIDPITVELSTVVRREPIEGLALPVGRPVVSTQSFSTSLRLKLHEVGYIEIPSIEGKYAILFIGLESIIDPASP